MKKTRGGVSRREFLNTGLAGATTLAGAPWTTAAPRDRARVRGACMRDIIDASKRGIEDSDRIRVFNQRGSVTLRAELTDDMLPNIVILLHGWWASRIGGSSANALTPDSLADLGGGGTLHDTWVEVEKI